MNKKILKVGLVAAMFTLVGLSCGGEDEADQVASEKVVAVMTQVVEISDQEMVRTYTGSLEGQKQAVIYCKISEAVEKVRVREGDHVKAEQVIVSLNKSGPSSSYQQAKSLYLNAEKQNNRMAYLFDEGAVSEAAADGARTEYEVARAAFDAAARLVDIRSPFAGTVTSVDVVDGNYLSAGQVVATVASVDRLRVRFPINTSDIQLVSLDDEVRIAVDALGLVATGTVTAVARSADPATRSYEVEATLDNSDGLFTPGMFVRVSLIVEQLEGVLVIPRNAVLNLGGRDVVYIVNEDTAERRVVELGPEVNGSVVIVSGLNPGDILVTLGQDYLEDGVKVNITGTATGE
ncbi:MAG: efflux RND transporter periplasmic adaptor subunit [candidate division Zixibacteria bacterium]|nr:efflux RND transporter periplasmic adaptor subunit [candidate division Zixibacteria bacterium]